MLLSVVSSPLAHISSSSVARFPFLTKNNSPALVEQTNNCFMMDVAREVFFFLDNVCLLGLLL